MKSSTTDAAFKKFVQDWSENNTACYVNKQTHLDICHKNLNRYGNESDTLTF